MARTWNEIQKDFDNVRAVRKAAEAAEARLEAEGDAKVAPWALGLAALLGVGAWAASTRTPLTPTPAPAKPVARESWAEARRRESAKMDAGWARDAAVEAENRAMDAWTRAVGRFDGRDDAALNLAKTKYEAAVVVAKVARERYSALA